MAALCAIAVIAGCGTTKSYIATEQLLLSDAVDSTIAQLDFTPLSGRRVFLDTAFVSTVRSKTGAGLISHEYIISAVREQMLSAGCRLSAAREDAEIIAELRLGAMGTDGHSVNFGIPATDNSGPGQLAGTSLLPSLPELSLAKRESMSGGAKVAVFAYRRESREAVWQSGLAQATSQATDTWVLGVGPKQHGSIHEHDKPEPVEQLAAKKPTKSAWTIVADRAKHRKPEPAVVR